MKKLIVIIVAVVALGGLGYFVFQKWPSSETSPASDKSSSSATSAGQLLGLWQKNEGNFVYFLEFKGNEFCQGGSGGTPETFVCSQYLPYSVSGNTLIVGSSPFAEWKIANGKLELKPRHKQEKDVYIKVR